LEHFFGHDWEIVPAGGATGEAFYAEHEENKYFLKRNTSPFLASLSAEGIVPKLVWTKRLETGDVFTAQQWLNGRELHPAEMNSEKVARLLKKIHTSDVLLSMLKRLGKTPVTISNSYESLLTELDHEVLQQKNVQEALKFLETNIPYVQHESEVVCHCDVNHNNWLLSDNNQLYLIDWDGAVVGDPAIDIGELLYWYIPRENWEQWLHLYGIELNDRLFLRMKWYVIKQTLYTIQWSKEKGQLAEMNKWLRCLPLYFSL
jgi:thiamine kinase-like enzyme